MAGKLVSKDCRSGTKISRSQKNSTKPKRDAGSGEKKRSSFKGNPCFNLPGPISDQWKKKSASPEVGRRNAQDVVTE